MMITLEGKSVFGGVAIGKIQFYKRNEITIKRTRVEDVEAEVERFQNAKAKTLELLKGLYEKALEDVGEANAMIFEAHQLMLEDPDYVESIENIIRTQDVNAEYAIGATADNFAAIFEAMDDAYMQGRAADVRDVSERLLQALSSQNETVMVMDEPVIIAADDLVPSETVQLDKEKVLSFVTMYGSANSHTAILARTMNIPAVIGLGEALKEEYDGKVAIVDGVDGKVYIDPDEEVKKEYEIRRQADKEEREELLKLRREPDITKDGRKIEIYANIGNMDDLNSVLYYGTAGIGLLRSEFQYLGRENYPRENELFLAYKKIAETMGEKLTVIRTADLGADKQAEYLNIPDETNPIMGNRGIRLCLDRKRMFKAQLRAIFRASAYGNLALMYPMISSEEEMDEIEEIIREVKIGLDEKGIPYKHIKTGIMIETPAAVMISRELARRVDFLSLGTNDLSQYTLAMDRQNPLLRKKYNDHHPAVLRMIQMVIEAGHAENRRVCICGELAADTALTEEFLRMGVDCLSVVPACILPVRRALRQVDLSDMRR